MIRYHYKIGLPRGFERPRGVRPLFFSNHALQRVRELNVLPPARLDLAAARLIELTLDGPRERGLYRVAYNARVDLCLVVEHGTGLVVTLWLNRRDDNHETLNRARYAKP